MTQNDEVVHPLNLDLRRHAGNETSEKENAIADLSEIDVRALYHELQVHQVELEMQNEELRRVHADLASSEEKYRDLYEFAPIGYLTLECSGKVLDANLTAASLLGIEREHLENNRFQAYLSQSSIPEFNAFCSHVIESDSKQTIELKLNPNGLNGRDRLWVLIEGKAIKDRIHNGFMMAVIDITERKRIEEALCQSEERYRRLFEVEFDAIFLIDCDS
jgi:PAS domain S-box-containing protein